MSAEIRPPAKISIVEPLPFPIVPIRSEEWTDESLSKVLSTLATQPYFFDDETKASLPMAKEAIKRGGMYCFSLLGHNGILRAYGIRPKRTAIIDVMIWGNRREILKKFGPAFDIRKTVIEALFRWIQVEHIRAWRIPENKAARNFLRRCGFKREGLLRKELLVNGKLSDMELWGILKEEM